MALTLSVPNYKDNNIVEKASVKVDATSGQPGVVFDNTQNFAAHDFVLIGKVGGRLSRIYQIASVSGQNVTMSTNLVDYTERGTEISKLFGDSVKVYTAPYAQGVTPTSFSPLSGGLVTIDPDQDSTSVTDPAGSDQVWYKFTYYNSYSAAETQLADSTAMRDTRANDYCSLADIRHEAGFDSEFQITDTDIAFHRTAAQARINGMLAGKYTIPFSQPIDPQIGDITMRLAAGYLLIAERGIFDGMDKSKGEKMRDDALAQLKDLQAGTSVLTTVDGAPTVTPDGGSFSSGFDATRPAMFVLEYLDGYTGREY